MEPSQLEAHPFIKAVHECISKVFKSARKQAERDLASAVKELKKLKRVEDESKASAQLKKVLSRLQKAKAKVSPL